MTLRPIHTYRRITPEGMEKVPKQWMPAMHMRYPSDNSHIFERWYFDMWSAADVAGRIYLPVQWTAYYCNNKFGDDKQAIKRLQLYLDKLDTSKKYYTIVQFDHGILNNVAHLDLKIFSMSGGRIDVALPLICTAHKQPPRVKQEYFASFIGSNTHPCRKAVFELSGKPGYFVTHVHHPLPEYTRIMASSTFTLAPRGVGPSSFRIAEAVLSGSIPVYISDKHVLPYGMAFDYGVILQPGEDIDAVLRGSDVSALQRRLAEVRHLFTYQGCKAWMKKKLDE